MVVKYYKLKPKMIHDTEKKEKEGDFTKLHNENFVKLLYSSGIMGRVKKTGHVGYTREKRNEHKVLWKI
jgi:hypothetical protein